MNSRRSFRTPFASVSLLAAGTLAATPLAADEPTATLPTLYLQAQETANIAPATTYTSPISNLEFNPRLDLQSRNMAEAQGDVTVRGGIFENTGFQIGAATLLDPQTGHYFAELPIAPEMLETANVRTGVDNALHGFNSSVATVHYGWSQITDGGSLTAGFGDHDLNFQRIHSGWTGSINDTGAWTWGVEADYARSESDGTRAFGDHDFDRFSGRVQLLGPDSQTDFFAGYQSKFFGWPGMYTANPANHETENLKTRLFAVNHQQWYGADNHWEATLYHRRHDDHYVFRRENPALFQAFHTTKVTAFAAAGRHAFDSAFALNYATQVTADTIDSTTLNQNVTSRSYFKVTLLPEYRRDLNATDQLTLRAGASFDDSNRDDSQVSPIFDVTWQRTHTANRSEKIYLSYATTSQVPGYTAISGATAGLFASNPDLERETARNLELGIHLQRPDWSFEAAVFHRWDDDLVDWTYSDALPSARQANNVDMETLGVELIGTRRWGSFEGIASYAYLHKNENYGDNNIDASFYALNFPEHRATLGVIWRPIHSIEVRIDNEWRKQKPNSLRSSDDDAFFTHLGISFFPPRVEGLELFVAVDNAWDDDFQDVPGTPGRGDQYSAGATWRW